MKTLTVRFGYLSGEIFDGKEAWIGIKKIDSLGNPATFTVQYAGDNHCFDYECSPAYMAKLCGADEVEIVFRGEALK